jgi:hypothetical protein
MNRTTIVTIGIVVAAAACVAGAISMRPIDLPPPAFEDTGEVLFANFSDPNLAAALSVKAWDDKEARLTDFSVEMKDGRWVIPSHNDYPADGTERMGKAAASFLDVEKDIVRSDDPKDHPEFGVLDPEDPNAKDGERGEHITIKDESGSILVDIIIGKDVENKEGFRFVRYPETNRVYAARIAPDISTNFVDWIEKDLLKLDRDTVVEIVSNSYRVDEKTQQVVESVPMKFVLEGGVEELYPESSEEAPKPKPTGDWRPAEGVVIPPGKEFNPTKVKQTYGAASRMKIVGVRKQPKPLTDVALRAKGFFLSSDMSRLYGNEGELQIVCKDGVIYNLYFGEVTYDTGRALTAGEGEGEAEGAGEEANANRYMFVHVTYDPERDQSATMPPPAEDELRSEPRAKALRARFDEWFYVIPNSSYSQMHKVPDDFFKDAK